MTICGLRQHTKINLLKEYQIEPLLKLASYVTNQSCEKQCVSHCATNLVLGNPLSLSMFRNIMKSEMCVCVRLLWYEIKGYKAFWIGQIDWLHSEKSRKVN